MADTTAEQLSVLMDGESDVREAEFTLRRLAKDAELKARWERYHLISDALRNNLPTAIDVRFAERLQQALDAEAALNTPVVRTLPAWYKPAVGFGLAASVTLAVALVALGTGQPDPLATPAVATRTPLPTPVAVAPDAEPVLESRLNSYVVNHSEYASMNSVHGVLPYVRMVGYESSKR
jgi:sigma-E factor negative regulatory protein RseA